MKKMKTTDRTDIKALGMLYLCALPSLLRQYLLFVIADNTSTAPFAAVYNHNLNDDDDSFAYLAAESNLDDLMGGYY